MKNLIITSFFNSLKIYINKRMFINFVLGACKTKFTRIYIRNYSLFFLLKVYGLSFITKDKF